MLSKANKQKVLEAQAEAFRNLSTFHSLATRDWDKLVSSKALSKLSMETINLSLLLEKISVVKREIDDMIDKMPDLKEPEYEPIIATIFPNPPKWLEENFHDLSTDGTCSIRFERTIDKANLVYELIDLEDDKKKIVNRTDWLNALNLLAQQVGVKLFVGGVKNPVDLLDAGNWDAEVVDAFRQLAFFGEVIYG